MSNSDHISEKNLPWLLPASGKSKLTPGLYLVATPIGNLRDMTLRALDTLALSDCVLCEDTRVSAKLLSAYGIKKKMIPYHDHTTEGQRAAVIERLLAGQVISLISDAGTPLIADPGYKLVQACLDAGIPVTTLPGPCAVVSALQLSAMPSDNFTFIGFLPPKSKARQDVLTRWQAAPSTLIAYETAPRLLKALVDIQEALPGRKVAVVREITKLYEEARIDDVSVLIDWYNTHGLPKGEIVLVIAPPSDQASTEEDVRAALRTALGMHPTKKAASLVATQTGWSKSDVYALALEVKNEL